MKQIHIVPGWSEGKWHYKQLAKEFGNEFALTSNTREADIVFAHSSGCYSLPENNAKLIVLLDPPYWPGKSIFSRIVRHVILDAPKQIRRYGLKRWLNLRFYNLIYAITRPWEHIKIWRSLRQTLKISSKSSIIIIRNKDDAYCGPQLEALAKISKARFVEHEGLHEDCWMFPKAILSEI